MSDSIILDVKHLNTEFMVDRKRVGIVKDVSFQLRKGKTLAIVGESGCGKSMTVHSLLKLVPKNAMVSAEAIIYRSYKNGTEKEYDLSKLPPYGKDFRSLRGTEISMIFQDPMASLNPVYRVGDQIIEGLLQHNPRMKKKDAMDAAVEMLRNLGIPSPEQRINAFPHQLSGGMKQRVVIAIAMICNPEIIIADEPTTALDVTIQAQIMELMKKLQLENHKSIIMITHNMGLVADMADDAIVMYMGRIVEQATVEEIFNHPQHPYTVALLNSVPMIGADKRNELSTIPGVTPNPADLTEGCEFADRCNYCTAGCRKGNIPFVEVSVNHFVRCLKYSDLSEGN